MEFVRINDVVNELKFQEKQLLSFLKKYRLEDFNSIEDIIGTIDLYFDFAIHGIEEHLETFTHNDKNAIE